MKFSALALLLPTLSIISPSLADPCTTTIVRKEIRDLTQSEWEKTKIALNRAHGDGIFDRYAEIHDKYFGRIHNNSVFHPWHRRFILDFEREIQQYYPEFALPYWDTSLDYRAPAQSQILTPEYMGGNGRSGDGCVIDGVHANWTVNYPDRHCLKREFNSGDTISPWYSEEYSLALLYSSHNMTSFWNKVIATEHIEVHIGIGGDLNLQWSPVDFMFMLLHTNADRLWKRWQDNGHALTMDEEGDVEDTPITLESAMPFFNQPVKSVISLGENDMCYEYQLPLSSSHMKNECKSSRAVEINLASSLPERLLKKWFPGLGPLPERKTDRGIILDNGSICPLHPDVLPIPDTRGIELSPLIPLSYMPIQYWAKGLVTDLNNIGYHPLY